MKVRRGKNGLGNLSCLFSMNDADEIYEAYPRHIGKRDAMRAIEKAIQRLIKGEYKGQALSESQAIAGLKNRTIQFAESSAGKRGNFTPYPATWFNRSSYLDDPQEWEHGETFKQAGTGQCRKHPHSGRTPSGGCFSCYAEANGYHDVG
jgi:hypothetical protein